MPSLFRSVRQYHHCTSLSTVYCLGPLGSSPCWKLAYTCLYCDLGTIISGNLLFFGSRRDTLFFLIFRRWKNFIVWQNIFSSGNMCRCILLDRIVHDKHNNRLH